MYLITVLLLMFVLPVGMTWYDYQQAIHPSLLFLAGKWFVFWSAGARLLIAGLWQFFQPQFTLTEIFGIRSGEARPIVRELGVANFATGLVGMLSLYWTAFLVPVAIIAGIFYGVAGIEHAFRKNRSLNETVAMVSDLFVCAALAVFLVSRAI
jgi:hypothetical protein